MTVLRWRMELCMEFGAWSLISILFIALESSTLLQMRFLEFTALACIGLHFMISVPRCVTRVSHVCITWCVQKFYRILLKMFAKQFAIVAYVRSSNFYKLPAAHLVEATQPFKR